MAREAVGDDKHVIGSAAHRGKKSTLATPHRHLILLAPLKSEGPRESTAARVENLVVQPQLVEEPLVCIECHDRLVVAVDVYQRPTIEPRRIVADFVQKLCEGKELLFEALSIFIMGQEICEL